MKMLRTSLPREDGSQQLCDTIQHEGRLSLAPEWLEDPSKPYGKPARVPLRGEVAFVLEHPVPEAVLQGRVHGP